MNSWLHSPGHRRNIESPHSVHIGVGHYYGTRPAAGKHNWTQDFAAATYCRFTGLELSAQAIYGKPGTDLEWFQYWRGFCRDWLLSLGIKEEEMRLRDHSPEELCFYSKGTTDIEFLFPFGWGELWGIADRTDYD